MVVGPKPTRSNGLGDFARRDAEVRTIADRLWGPCDGTTVQEHAYGKGKIIWGKTLRDILTQRGIGPDFAAYSPRSDIQYPLDYIHRRTPEADIYFVSNKQNRWEEVACVFRVADRVPQLWMPDTGQIRACRFERDGEDNTRVALRLAPYGSVFVVFHETVEKLPMVQEVPASQNGQAIDGPWEVRFAPGWGAPASKVFAELISWTESADEGVKYFSGIASYHNEFDVAADRLTSDKRIVLDLGEVRFVAEVYVNGQSQGILWKPPYQVEITDAVRIGTNELVVEVANTWSNRLVGDARSPEGPKFCRTNIDKSLTWEVPWKDTPLLDSGLLGPVRLIEIRH
jgi:hypothetical protein